MFFNHWRGSFEAWLIIGRRSLKGSIHNLDLRVHRMTFKVLSSPWGFMVLFLLCIYAGDVWHCVRQALRMNRSTVWNGDGANIYFVFQFLETVFVWEAVWPVTFCNIWSPAILSLFTVKCMENRLPDGALWSLRSNHSQVNKHGPSTLGLAFSLCKMELGSSAWGPERGEICPLPAASN